MHCCKLCHSSRKPLCTLQSPHSDQVVPDFQTFRSVTSDEKSWVPSKATTQRSSQSATYACVVAPWHVSTLETPEMHLYPHDHDGTELSQ